MTLEPKLYEGHILLFLLASLCVASQFLQLWSQTVNDPLRDKRWQKLHTNRYPENSLQSHICLGFGLFSQLSMRHALRKVVYARIGQGRTLINPSKWSNLLPTLLQLWHLNHVNFLGFCTLFFFLSQVTLLIAYVLKKLLHCISYCIGSDVDVASIFVIFFHPGIRCLTQQKWKRPIPLLSLISRALLGEKVGAGSKDIDSTGLGHCS